MIKRTLPVFLLVVVAWSAPALAQAGMQGGRNGSLYDVTTRRANTQMVKATFMGVTAERVSPAMASQLKLPKGLGLVVTHVVPDGPADMAGLQKHDVLHKLDDQLLVNFEQFAVLIRLHEPGDTVTLRVIRGGEPMSLDATLIESEAPETSMGLGGMPGMGMGGEMGMGWGTGENHSSRRGMFMPGTGVPQMRGGMGAGLPYKPFMMPGEGYSIGTDGVFKLRVIDSDHTIHIYSTGQGDKQVKVKVEDASGEVLFDGPWEACKDSASSGVPERVIGKIQSLFDTPDFGQPIRIEFDEIEVIQPPKPPVSGDGS